MRKVLVLFLLSVLMVTLSSCNDVYVTTNENKEEKVDTSQTVSKPIIETEPVKAPETTKTIEKSITSYSVGDIVEFGRWEQDNNTNNGWEPIEWIVLDRNGNDYLLLSKYALASQSYNNKSGATTWQTCWLREFLNSSFLCNAFSADEIYQIIEYNGDQVFCLSGYEAEKYLPSAQAKKTSATPYAQACGSYQEDGVCGWWLRSRGDTFDVAARVNIKGEILTCDSSEGGVERTDYSVRPAVWVRFD